MTTYNILGKQRSVVVDITYSTADAKGLVSKIDVIPTAPSNLIAISEFLYEVKKNYSNSDELLATINHYCNAPLEQLKAEQANTGGIKK